MTRLAFPVLSASTAWLLRRIERAYEELGQLSPQASLTGWTFYLLHAALTLTTVRRKGRLQVVAWRLALLGASIFRSARFAGERSLESRRSLASQRYTLPTIAGRVVHLQCFVSRKNEPLA